MFNCVYGSSGIRDDLLRLLDEEPSSIQLCALHMEMRNAEQLLASIGLIGLSGGFSPRGK